MSSNNSERDEERHNYSFKFNVGGVKEHLTGVLRDYKGWIGRNPGRASDVESFLKILAYLFPGRIRGNSTVLPELLYSTANAISFWHDHLLREEQQLSADIARSKKLVPPREDRNGNCTGVNGNSQASTSERNIRGNPVESRKKQVFRLQVALSILEYFEVFLEVAGRRLWGEQGKWIVIFVMQTIKATIRTVLVFYFKTGLVRTPAIPSFDRSHLHSGRVAPPLETAAVLKHSGRVIRKLYASPPMHSRDWNVPDLPLSYETEVELPTERAIAEMIHIARPLCHLISVGACGTSSWKPWLLSLGMDVTSLYLHGDSTNYRKSEQIELRKRSLCLLIYLLRSPFYDRATKARLISTLEALGSRIPLFGNIFRILAQAIPQWQSTYSYVWST